MLGYRKQPYNRKIDLMASKQFYHNGWDSTDNRFHQKIKSRLDFIKN